MLKASSPPLGMTPEHNSNGALSYFVKTVVQSEVLPEQGNVDTRVNVMTPGTPLLRVPLLIP
jgi:hypothetical protein